MYILEYIMEIRDFWEGYYRNVKPYKGQTGKGVFVNKKEILKENVLLGLKLEDWLRPEWVGKEEKNLIFFPKIYKNVVDGDVLAVFVNNKETFSAIVKKGNQIIFNFDPEETIKFLIAEKYYKPKRRFYTHFPIHFHVFPGWFRKFLKNIFFNLFFLSKKQIGFPSWTVEKSVELIRYALLRGLELVGNKKIELSSWPNGKKYVVCLTHDVETKEGIKRMPLIERIERKHNVKSSWSIVSNHYKIDFNLFDNLIKDGDEVLLHGYNHDNKLVYLTKKGMKKRFVKMDRLRRRYGIKGFRSPCLLRNKLLYDTLGKMGYLYDSSAIDTEMNSQVAERNGCCTIFPYMINNLVEIPLTLPQDSTLLTKGYSGKRILDIWINKLSFIRGLGGVAVINTHPEPHLIGGRAVIYDQFISYIKKDRDAWITTMGELAEYVNKRLNLKNNNVL